MAAAALPFVIAGSTLCATYAAGWSRAPPFSLSNVGAGGFGQAVLSLGCAAYVYAWWTLAQRNRGWVEHVLTVLAGVTLLTTALFSNDDFPSFHDAIGGVGTFSAYFYLGAVLGWRGFTVVRVLATLTMASAMTALAALYMSGDGGFDSVDVGFGAIEAVGWLAHAVAVGTTI